MMASVSGIDDDKLGAVSKSQVRQALLLHNGYKILKLAKDVIQNWRQCLSRVVSIFLA